MKKRMLKLILIFISVNLLFSLCFSDGLAAKDQSFKPGSIIVNFGKDPSHNLNFTWNTTTDFRKGCLQYFEASISKNFETAAEKSFETAAAKSFETRTDADVRMIHKVALTGLKPGTDYIYRVGNCQGSYGRQGAFKTAGLDIKEFTFINITDTQGANSKDYSKWKTTLNKALSSFPDASFLLHTGDMVDNGQKITDWDLFTKAAETELMNLPIMPVLGNHDANNYNFTNPNAKNFREHFMLPEEKDTGTPVGTVYSFDYGQAHISVMNTQSGGYSKKKQAEWLRRDIKKTDKPWRIVALHRGPYGARYDTTDIRKAWVPVFDELGVDLVLAGHDHTYVRSHIMKGNTVYLTVNSGGVKFYPVKKRSWQETALQPSCQMYLAVTVSADRLEVGAYDVKGKKWDGFIMKNSGTN